MYPHFDAAAQFPANEAERDYPQVAQFTFDVCAPFEYLQVAEYQTSPQYFWSSAHVPGNAPRPSLKVLSPSATPETIYQSQDFALDFSELSPLPGLADLRSLGYSLGAGHYDKGLSLEFDLEFPHDAFGPYPALPSPPNHIAEVEEGRAEHNGCRESNGDAPSDQLHLISTIFPMDTTCSLSPLELDPICGLPLTSATSTPTKMSFHLRPGLLTGRGSPTPTRENIPGLVQHVFAGLRSFNHTKSPRINDAETSPDRASRIRRPGPLPLPIQSPITHASLLLARPESSLSQASVSTTDSRDGGEWAYSDNDEVEYVGDLPESPARTPLFLPSDSEDSEAVASDDGFDADAELTAGDAGRLSADSDTDTTRSASSLSMSSSRDLRLKRHSLFSIAMGRYAYAGSDAEDSDSGSTYSAGDEFSGFEYEYEAPEPDAEKIFWLQEEREKRAMRAGKRAKAWQWEIAAEDGFLARFFTS
ncbi:hypothetical protein HMN09_00855200 [Mycena chlorophos]|uniref:Uncharacterized protein n=1 Tax=Mycena chlorophos TaxID=658473 RepID=A0A8H6STN6_MYCCL|nr:hypothetical protein HMN09_00855200 [Mycena chlorophos]